MMEQQAKPAPLSSEVLLRVVTTGRKTRIPHVVVVRFVRSDGVFFVLAGRAASDWVQNALSTGSAGVRLGDYSYEVAAAIEKERGTILQLFSRKYGSSLVDDWYARAEACLRLTPLAPPHLRGAVKGEGDVRSDFADWKRRRVGYYEGVARAFDSASEEYDFTIRSNFINRWIRERSISVLLERTRQDDTLVEIGCGTGAEAVEVSRHVQRIVATDISEKMVALLRRKVAARGLDQKISAVQVGAARISEVSSSLPGGKVRVAYSFNGALNCEPSIGSVSGELSKIVQDGGYFVCSIRNTLCISEAIAHGAALQFEKMAPRKKQPIMVSVGGMDIPSYYYSPKTFAGLFSDNFRVRKIIGLPAILPPAYLSDLYFRVRPALSFTETVEKTVAGHFPFNRFGDQTLFVFQKV